MNRKFYLLPVFLCLLFVSEVFSATVTITPTETDDDTKLIQTSLDGLSPGDTLQLNGDFIHKKTIYLVSDFTWILNGSLTLAKNSAKMLDDYGLRYEGFDNSRSTAIATREGAKHIDFSGGIIYGNGDFNGRPTGLPRVRQVNIVFAEECYFHDFTVEDASDDCFTLGAASHHNRVERVIGRHAGGRVEKDGGNALTDVGHHNTWVDCVADQGGSDGWTPKCQYSTFIRCIASNNMGPGFGMYAREEGYANNKDVGAHIIGNQFIDCVAYGSKKSAGFSFDISSNCPGAIVRDNFIQAVCYNNQGSGVMFRNKDNAQTGIIKDNVVDIVCYSNKGLTGKGNINSWAGGLGMENDNSPTHNLIENITGSIVSYNNKKDVNTRGGKNCNITAYHPEEEKYPISDDKGSGNNTLTVINFNCSDELAEWCQLNYCGVDTGGSYGCILPYSTTDMRIHKDSVNWSSGVVEISCASSVKISMYMEGLSDTTMESNDYLNVFYKVDGGPRQTISENTDGFATKMVSKSDIMGKSIELIIQAKNSSSNEIYHVSNILIEREYVTQGDNTYLDDCDKLIGWGTHSTNEIAQSAEVKQGVGCLEMTGNGSNEFRKKFTTPVKSSATPENGVINFWYYISDVSQIGETINVELGSGGVNDTLEYGWSVIAKGLQDGWNEISLNISDALVTGGPADLNAINWFRISNNKKTGIVTTRLDAIQVLGGKPTSIINNYGGNETMSLQNYPNPFNGTTTISFELTEYSEVSLNIFNVRGQKVGTLLSNESCSSGIHSKVWSSSSFNNGIYIFVLRAVTENGVLVEAKKMNVLK